MALKRQVERFDFVFMIVLQSEVLEQINVISKMLQAKDTDLH